MLGTVVDNPM